MTIGIDYGNGITNIDKNTGIRYGVIPMHDVSQAWCDSSEPDYGEPCCPKCGNDCCEYDDEKHEEFTAYSRSSCADFACDHCEHYLDSSEVYGDEALAFNLDDGEYVCAQLGNDCDIFVLKSPYFTHAQFCSPCAPGAGYLRNYTPNGPKTYCLGHDWFDGNSCPYPVYSVATGELVFEPSAE